MISAVILTKNEEVNLPVCLEGLKWCDEILVIDDDSDDQTITIAKENGAKVFIHSLNNDFAAQRNFGLEKAKGEWVLFIDADEKVTPQLAAEIKETVKNGKENGYYLKRLDNFLDKWLKFGETGDIKLLRLGKKGNGEWERKVHEVWNIKTQNNVSLQNSLLHYPHRTLKEFLLDLNCYSSINAGIFYNLGKRAGVLQIVIYPVGKFFLNYVFKKGFLDGTPGFIMAMMMSLHSFLTRVKIYQLRTKITKNI